MRLASYAVVVVIVLLLRLRTAGKPMPLTPPMLLIRPMILLILSAWLTWLAKPWADPQTLGIMAACLLVGAVIGWWRGRFVHIEVHPENHTVTTVTPVFAVLLLVALVIGRAAASFFLRASANPLSLEGMRLNAEFVLFAFGALGFTALEMFLRAQRLLNEARAASAARGAS
jgi:multisubunit Na+/H+ antiporter MnhC subunit